MDSLGVRFGWIRRRMYESKGQRICGDLILVPSDRSSHFIREDFIFVCLFALMEVANASVESALLYLYSRILVSS